MIAKLTGRVDQAGDGFAVLDVGGVGYRAFCSSRCLARLPAVGGEASLLIETHVSQDHIHLYGFADAAERDWFRLLTTVQGVGSKVALALLSTLSPAELATAIAAQDRATLARAQGVGPKLAGRIAAELKDKAGNIALGAVAVAGGVNELDRIGADAVSALVNLGYRRMDAFGAVLDAQRRLGAAASLDALIKAGLRELGS
ncbi:MAG TPA: Holliday junction branch migration protein RuvA [Alphaproteobacteria bacterium]|nr:Holliday junction branch migration protein RuvA [Alphaproteobacteria bacterium]